MRQPWAKSNSKVVYENAWIRLHEDELTTASGESGIYGVVETKAQAVSIVALSKEREICLVHEYRHPVGSFLWRIPTGGTTNDNSDPLSAAKSELVEETGWFATSWRLLGRVHPMSGLCQESAHIFSARNLQYCGPLPDSNEVIDQVCFRSIAEITRMIRDGQLTDGQTIAALAVAAAVRLV